MNSREYKRKNVVNSSFMWLKSVRE